jgi:glycosyltransferase involved in cell wall biosynthesis
MAASIRIGVVIAAYDMADWIGTCLSSLLDQTHTDWTAIVVDDGSRDCTGSVVACFRDPRIRLVRQPNAGVSAARNRGLAEVGGAAVLFLDADDWLAPDALARMAAALAARPDAAAVWGRFAYMGATAAPGDRPLQLVRPRLRGTDAVAPLLVGNRFANGGHVLVRRCAAARAGRFNTRLRFGEDWDYWVRIALVGALAPVPGAAPLLFVRQRGDGAYRSRATDLGAFIPAMVSIFNNPDVQARYSAKRLAALGRAGQAEKVWIAGRAMLDAGRRPEGLGLLRRSVRNCPTPRRLALLLALHVKAVVQPGFAAHVLRAAAGGFSVIRRTPMSNVK